MSIREELDLITELSDQYYTTKTADMDAFEKHRFVSIILTSFIADVMTNQGCCATTKAFNALFGLLTNLKNVLASNGHGHVIRDTMD